MKKIVQKIGIFSVIIGVPLVAFATDTPMDLVKQMQNLLNQYTDKIRLLEAENTLLKATLAKNGISIPLDEYNAIYASGTTSTGTIAAPTPAAATPLQTSFIAQFRKDWPAVREAYGMPIDSQVGMYEFVENTAGNNAFVDIFYGNGTPEWAYNYKLLYEFDKTNFSRKLLGLFQYDSTQKAYITKRGSNPFAGTNRQKIRETTASINTSTSTSVTQPSKPATNNAEATTIETKMRDLYLARKYSEVISISDEYLKNNSATYMILFHRYRTYFAQGQYQKALDEINKMQTAKLADERIYCDAYAIATVVKNSSLITKYKNLAGSGCKITPNS